MKGWRIAAIAAAFTVASCATLQQESRIARSPEPFDLSGRIFASHDEHGFSSNLRWQHLAERDEIWLLTPLGQAMAHIVDEADGVTVQSADGKQYQGSSAAELTRQALGWELPLTRLQYWVRGEVAPGSSPQAVDRDGSGRLLRLQQDGWHIALKHYPPDQYSGLPRRIEIARGSAEKIRMAIDSWRRDAR